MTVPVNQGIAVGCDVGTADCDKRCHQDPRFARDVAESTGYVPNAILAMPLETSAACSESSRSSIGRMTHSAEARTWRCSACSPTRPPWPSRTHAHFHLGPEVLFGGRRRVKKGVFANLCSGAGRGRTTPDAELAELAASFSELAAAGPAERRAATRCWDSSRPMCARGASVVKPAWSWQFDSDQLSAPRV